MQQRGNQPQGGQPSRQVSHGISTPVALGVPVHNVHLLHQHVMRQVGVPLGDPWIMQRQEGEPIPTSIEPPEVFDL